MTIRLRDRYQLEASTESLISMSVMAKWSTKTILMRSILAVFLNSIVSYLLPQTMTTLAISWESSQTLVNLPANRLMLEFLKRHNSEVKIIKSLNCDKVKKMVSSQVPCHSKTRFRLLERLAARYLTDLRVAITIWAQLCINCTEITIKPVSTAR